MRGHRYKKSGWFGESYRHYLAAKGIATKYLYGKRSAIADRAHIINGKYVPTAQEMNERFSDIEYYEGIRDKRITEITEDNTYFAEKKQSVKSIPIDIEKPKEGRIYPVSPEDVRKALKEEDPGNLKGLKGIEFAEPKGEQKEAWGQYVRSRRVIKIFSQPYEDGKIDGQDPEKLHRHIINYVIPHEVGHHRALEINKITDKNLYMAEARADANVLKMDPDDPSVYMLKAQ